MTSADLLDLYNSLTGRAVADSILDTTKYKALSRAEREVITKIASVRPESLYPKVSTTSIPTMVTTDNNVFTFGTDGDGNAIVPFGDCQIYQKYTDIPDRPLRPDWDYVAEGSQIRLPRNRTITFPLFFRGIIMPPAITATENPHLIPTDINELTALRAAHHFAESGNVRNAALADRMTVRWRERYPDVLLLLKRQFSRGGALTTWSLRDVLTPLL